jgi:ribosomal protein L37AE/L43A
MNKRPVIICNRAPLSTSAGWIHIVPKGELRNGEAGIVQVLDDESLDSIMAGIAKDKNRLGDNWTGIYAGREHFIYDSDKDSAALGWFKDFQRRDDGIWANEDGLTPAGQQAVKNREYKFTSFASDPSDLEKISNRTYRVKKIETVGFTNFSNAGSATREGSQLLTPITNRATLAKKPADGKCPTCEVDLEETDHAGIHVCPQCNSTFAEPGGSAASNQPTKIENKMKTVATKLGLAAEASEDAILAAVTKIMNRAAELEPLAGENTKLKNRITEIDGNAVDSLLVGYGVREQKVLNRLKPGLLAITDQAERIGYLTDLGYKPVEATKPAGGKVLNRGSGKLTEEESADGDGKAVAQKITNRANELKGKGVSWENAWNQAQREVLAAK